MPEPEQGTRQYLSLKSLSRMFVLDFIAKILIGVANLLVIRFMPAAQFVEFTWANAIRNFIGGAASSSFNHLYIVGYEELGFDRTPLSSGSLQALLLIGLALLTFPFSGLSPVVAVCAAALLLAGAGYEFVRTCVQRDLRFRLFPLLELARTAAALIALATAISWYRHDLPAASALLPQVLAYAAVIVISWPRVFTRLHHSAPLQLRRLVSAIARSDFRWLFLYDVLLAACGQLDILVLRVMSHPDQVAIYGSAQRYYLLLMLALATVQAVLLPALQRAETRRAVESIVFKNLRLLMLFAPTVMVGAIASIWLIPILDGGKYPEAVPVFQVLAASSILSLAFSPYSSLLMRFRLFRFQAGCVIAATTLNLLLMVLTVPRYGAVAAASSYLVTYGLMNASFWVRWRTLPHSQLPP